MMDLRNIILEKKDQLPKQIGKLVNRLYNKIEFESYFPDNKNVIKLKEFSTVEINNFLLECLAEYDKTERLFCEHHDIVGLRGVWAVLAFSKEENVLKYFDELIDKYIHGKPFYLHFLFALFGYSEIQHPLFDKIRKYYDEISDDLPAYILLKNLNIVPSDKYNWCVSLMITTDGEWLTPIQLTDEEKEQRFSFEMRLDDCFGSRLFGGLGDRLLDFPRDCHAGAFEGAASEGGADRGSICAAGYYPVHAQKYEDHYA